MSGGQDCAIHRHLETLGTSMEKDEASVLKPVAAGGPLLGIERNWYLI